MPSYNGIKHQDPKPVVRVRSMAFSASGTSSTLDTLLEEVMSAIAADDADADKLRELVTQTAPSVNPIMFTAPTPSALA